MFLLMGLFVASLSQAQQTDNKPPVKKIEVTGSAEIEITPDEIYLDIALREFKNKTTKVEMATLEGQLQKAVKDAGNASLSPEPGRGIRLSFRNYQMSGDMLTIDVDPSSNRLLGAKVSTYLDDPKDAVELVIQFGLLPDGTTYPASVNLNAQAKKITVQITNSDYRKLG